MRTKLFLFFVIAITLSCSNQIISPTIYSTVEQLQLGEIGEDKNYVLEKSYTHTAIPSYDQPIKVNVKQQAFSNSSFKAFEKATVHQNKKIAVNYVDSLETKPKFLKLQIADRVAVINNINNKENEDIEGYLQNKAEAHLISEVSMVFSAQQQTAILRADEVFVKTYGVKSYALHLYREGVLVDTIPFSEGISFKYGTSNFCWKEVRYSTWEIVDLVAQDERCPKGTFRFPKKDKDVNDYLKF